MWSTKPEKMTLCYIGGSINLRFKEGRKQMSKKITAFCPLSYSKGSRNKNILFSMV